MEIASHKRTPEQRRRWRFFTKNSAEGGSRTHNLVRGSVFETDAYASSATSARDNEENLVDLSGLEPLASSMPLRRSTN